MAFAETLERLRTAALERQRGRQPGRAIVSQGDLAELIGEFERVDQAMRTRSHDTTDFAALNALVEKHFADQDLSFDWEYGPSRLGPEHVGVFYPSYDFAYMADVRATLVAADPIAAIKAVKQHYERGFNFGKRSGEEEAKADILRVLGVYGVVERARQEQRAADERGEP